MSDYNEAARDAAESRAEALAEARADDRADRYQASAEARFYNYADNGDEPR